MPHRKPSAKVRKLLLSAEKEIATKGVEGASLAAAATAAGASPAAYNYYFSSGGSPAMDGVLREITRMHMSQADIRRRQVIAHFEGTLATPLHRIDDHQRVIALPLSPVPLSYEDLIAIVIIPMARHILTYRADSWFAQFQLMLNLHNPTLIISFLSESWGSTNQFVSDLIHQKLLEQGHSENDASFRIGLAVRLVSAQMAIFEQDMRNERMSETKIKPALTQIVHTIANTLAAQDTTSEPVHTLLDMI